MLRTELNTHQTPVKWTWTGRENVRLNASERSSPHVVQDWLAHLGLENHSSPPE